MPRRKSESAQTGKLAFTGAQRGDTPPDEQSGRSSDDGAGMALQIELLGGFRVVFGGRIVQPGDWRLRKARSLVKLLALAPGRRLHRDEVLDLLWPDLDEDAAANCLHQALFVARRALDPTGSAARRTLHLEGDLVVLRPPGPLWTDVEAFQYTAEVARETQDPADYQAAIELYRGDLLPEDRYEDWAARPREELRVRYLDLLLELAGLYEARGEPRSAVEALARVVATEPTHEEAHVGLMRLYALMGQRHQALRQYRLLTETLRRELDVEPDPAARSLYREILAGRFPAPAEGRVFDDRAPALAAPVGHAGYPAHRNGGRRHNLPAPLTSFVGRVREIDEIKRLIARSRLVTLTGAGGCGKTRLAVQVAGLLAAEFPDGAWLVDLAVVSDPDFMLPAIAAALGVREEAGRPLLATLVERLRDRRLLLLLDSCEHLVAACARIVETLLRSAPGLRVLATSRQPLGLAGEVAWRVPSLRLPDLLQLPEPPELARYEAVELFVERARSSLPTFTITNRNASAVAQICQRLDGIPLAIELAATRVKVLSPEQIALRLDDRFRLLSGGDRAAPSRQQTLAAAVAWSYELLSEPERRLFDRLSVFAGGCTLEAAESVCSGEGIAPDAVLDGLAQLVDKSLVQADTEAGGGARYRLLETLRQYGRQRLEERGETEMVERRHVAYYLALAEQTEPRLLGSGQALWLDRLEREHDNFRAALGWSVAHGEADLGLRLGGALWRFWYLRSYFTEGRQWLADLLALPSVEQGTAVQARALNGAGNLAYSQADYDSAEALHQEALAIRRQAGDRPGIAASLNNLGLIARRRGDYRRARSLLSEARAMNRALGIRYWEAIALNNLANVLADESDYTAARTHHEASLAIFTALGDEWGIAMVLGDLGNIALAEGDSRSAGAFFEESLVRRRRVGDRRGAAIALAGLGEVALSKGDPEGARSRFVESLLILHSLGDRLGAIEVIEGLAALAAAERQPERALRLAGSAAAQREALGATTSPVSRAALERRLEPARQALDAAAAAAAWALGRALPVEQAVEYALSTAPD